MKSKVTGNAKLGEETLQKIKKKTGGREGIGARGQRLLYNTRFPHLAYGAMIFKVLTPLHSKVRFTQNSCSMQELILVVFLDQMNLIRVPRDCYPTENDCVE